MEKQPNSRTCFLCGRQNDVSLKMSWFNNYDEQKVVGTVTVPEEYNSYPGIVHGGVVAAILDETAGRSILLDGQWDNFMVTAKLEVIYKQPTPCGEQLTAVGWINKKSRNFAHVAGELRLPDGSVTATCTAVIIRPPQDVFEKWEAEKEYWRVYED